MQIKFKLNYIILKDKMYSRRTYCPPPRPLNRGGGCNYPNRGYTYNTGYSGGGGSSTCCCIPRRWYHFDLVFTHCFLLISLLSKILLIFSSEYFLLVSRVFYEK